MIRQTNQNPRSSHVTCRKENSQCQRNLSLREDVRPEQCLNRSENKSETPNGAEQTNKNELGVNMTQNFRQLPQDLDELSDLPIVSRPVSGPKDSGGVPVGSGYYRHRSLFSRAIKPFMVQQQTLA